MRPGHFEKVDRYVNDRKDGSKWVVTCVACLAQEQSVTFFKGEARANKESLWRRVIGNGWFLTAGKKMQCGCHGTKEDNSALNPTVEWREWSPR